MCEILVLRAHNIGNWTATTSKYCKHRMDTVCDL